ncbi:hypothetical protein [Geothrix sp. PMB-07]|uniref:hypothetical protein n=1 Tax=Geothrix sp. PMB-07 TaxID=3068640 RepID=UPI00274292ED|nr:hypothetical protein [Geothrix sp. PMB-07]WLT30653.1 hypothetical protein Q9293_13105 [Geothrix sp. PMB-07]
MKTTSKIAIALVAAGPLLSYEGPEHRWLSQTAFTLALKIARQEIKTKKLRDGRSLPDTFGLLEDSNPSAKKSFGRITVLVDDVLYPNQMFGRQGKNGPTLKVLMTFIKTYSVGKSQVMARPGRHTSTMPTSKMEL